jgi:hypothetical protein
MKAKIDKIKMETLKAANFITLTKEKLFGSIRLLSESNKFSGKN